jgi:hypothetical protein
MDTKDKNLINIQKSAIEAISSNPSIVRDIKLALEAYIRKERILNSEIAKNKSIELLKTFSNTDISTLKITTNKEKWKIESDLLIQIILFRHEIFSFSIKMMCYETIILFFIIIMSSIKIIDIDRMTLQILVASTIAQVSAMIIIIIKSIFPDSLNKIITESKS